MPAVPADGVGLSNAHAPVRSPVTDGDMLYVCTEDGPLVAVDPDGSPVWQLRSPGHRTASHRWVWPSTTSEST